MNGKNNRMYHFICIMGPLTANPRPDNNDLTATGFEEVATNKCQKVRISWGLTLGWCSGGGHVRLVSVHVNNRRRQNCHWFTDDDDGGDGGFERRVYNKVRASTGVETRAPALLQVVRRRHCAPTHRLFHGDNASRTHAPNKRQLNGWWVCDGFLRKNRHDLVPVYTDTKLPKYHWQKIDFNNDKHHSVMTIRAKQIIMSFKVEKWISHWSATGELHCT